MVNRGTEFEEIAWVRLSPTHVVIRRRGDWPTMSAREQKLKP